MGERDLRFRPSPDGKALFDATTGLTWEADPGAAEVSWREATGEEPGDGWRLPTAAELMGLLAGLPPRGGTGPLLALAVGDVFWSASESPFASAAWVRVVEVGTNFRPAVRLRDKTALARGWRVREPSRDPRSR
jgi:hypothetical protein